MFQVRRKKHIYLDIYIFSFEMYKKIMLRIAYTRMQSARKARILF